MANTRSAAKRIRQSEVRRQKNRSYRSRMRTAVRRLRRAVDEGDAQTARELLPETLRLIDKTAQKDVVHANSAARTKSRLVRSVETLG